VNSWALGRPEGGNGLTRRCPRTVRGIRPDAGKPAWIRPKRPTSDLRHGHRRHRSHRLGRTVAGLPPTRLRTVPDILRDRAPHRARGEGRHSGADTPRSADACPVCHRGRGGSLTSANPHMGNHQRRTGSSAYKVDDSTTDRPEQGAPTDHERLDSPAPQFVPRPGAPGAARA
jgi:hypothetical protein